MDINLYLQDNPNLHPPDEVQIEHAAATPLADGRRVKVELAMTPFRERPNLEIAVHDHGDRVVAATSVIAAMQFKMEFTLHLRGMDDPAGDYTLRVTLYYDDISTPQDRCVVAFIIPSTSATSGASDR